MVCQKTKEKKDWKSVVVEDGEEGMLDGARGSSNPSEMTRTEMREKNNAGHRGKKRPVREPSRPVLNKYIIMLACWGVFNPFVSFLPRNSLLVFSVLSFLSFFFFFFFYFLFPILVSKRRIVRCFFPSSLFSSSFFFSSSSRLTDKI